MKKALAIFFFCQCLFAANFSARVDLSATSITTSFQLIPFGTTIHYIDSVYADNRSTVEVVVNCSLGGTTVPASNDPGNIYVGKGEAWALPDLAGFGNSCYLRFFSTTVSTGVVVINVIGG